MAENKILTCGRYKFELVIENSLAHYGNTDRIISTFLAVLYPYIMAKKQFNLIPENCFIDFSKFKTEIEALKFIKNIDENKYLDYINNIKNFIPQ